MVKLSSKEEKKKTEEPEKGGDDEKNEDKKGKGKEEGEGGAPAEGEAAPEPKKSKKKVIIMGVVALLLLIAGGAGAYFSGVFSKHEEKATTEAGTEGKPIDKPVFYTLPEFLINLNAGSKQTSFLKTTVVLELAKQDDVAVIEANLPRLVDGYNTYLRELRSSDLAGSAGIQRLREELLLRANKALSPVKVNDVLFKEIIVQ